MREAVTEPFANGLADGADRLPKVLWTLWLQGWGQAPQVPRRCLENMRLANPDWRVEALDRESLEDHLPPRTLAELDALTGTPTEYSDLVRLALLQRHGGVWMDATCVCAVPLNAWIHDVTRVGFFAFSRPGPQRELASWFLCARPGDAVVDALLSASLGYWRARDVPHDYFWMHDLFGTLILHHATVAERWSRVPKLSARHRFHYGPAALRLLARPAAEDERSLTDPPAPVFKLTLKVEGQGGGELVPPGSLLERLLDVDPTDALRAARFRRRALETLGRTAPE